MPRLLDVALPVPLHQVFSYLPGEAAPPEIQPGMRVVVPFRNTRYIGVVLGERESDEARAWKAVLQWPDQTPALRPALLATCRWISTYYAAPLGVALRTALPAQLTQARDPLPRPRVLRVAVALPLPESLRARDELFLRAPRQREVWEHIEAMGGRAAVSAVLDATGATPGVLQALVRRGLVRIEDQPSIRDPFADRPVANQPQHQPTAAQQAAIDAIATASPGEVLLLHGVTGSGKTLVYLEAIRRALAEPGATAIVLVPEIALTPQTVARFRAAFGDEVAVLHSALSDGERLDAWRALHTGARRIAVGARSAIFAPLDKVRIVIVDEEHEGSYKQGESPRYHARDVAIVRARHEGAVVVLGSATPSLESWAQVRSDHWRLVSLPDRVGGGVLPAVEVVDLRTPFQRARALAVAEHADGDRPVAPPQVVTPTLDPFRRIISAPLEDALRSCVARGEQAILLLNRRGYAAFMQCHACGDVVDCANCSISLTYHRVPERLSCHYCGHTQQQQTECRRCHGATVRQRGLGTQQVERALGERMPNLRIARMDLDTTGGKWAHADILDRVGRGEVDVLLGTQMIAKGLDFPNVTVVGVIDADVGLSMPDFRASERGFQLLAQVAGRSGRGTQPGRVFIQTRQPDHYAVQCALTHDVLAFVDREWQERRSPPYPPHARLVNLVISGLDETLVAETTGKMADWLRRLLFSQAIADLQVVGAAPCIVERIQTRWRWHLMLRGQDPATITKVIQYLVRRFPLPERGELRLSVDRDPLQLL